MKDLDFRGKLAKQVGRSPADKFAGSCCMSEASPKGKGRMPVVIIAIAMDQGGSSKMRRQLVHKTTRTNCNRLKAIKFAATSCNII